MLRDREDPQGLISGANPSSWYTFGPGEPVRCPAFHRGHRCDRAQDIAGEQVEVRIRVSHGPVIGGLKRRCRACGAALELRIREVAHA